MLITSERYTCMVVCVRKVNEILTYGETLDEFDISFKSCMYIISNGSNK